jgi:phosphoribosylanthranilate isomerase
MTTVERVRIKICCISSVAEARLALDAGADALGFVSAMPSGPGVIAEELIASIVSQLPPQTDSFLLTSATVASQIIAQHGRCGTTTIQLCDSVRPEELSELRAALPRTKLVQVIHVADQNSIDEAEACAGHVDALLLDSGNPLLSIKQLGGTGRLHDWSLSRQIVLRVGVPVYLAGGLNPDNARLAVTSVAPFGLDVCSGVRTECHLDEAKLRAFVSAARRRSLD